MDIEANLHDLLAAVHATSELRRQDAAPVRLTLDELIRYWEARWSVY